MAFYSGLLLLISVHSLLNGVKAGKQECSRVTSQYASNTKQFWQLSMSVDFVFSGNRLLASIRSDIDLLTKGYAFTTSIYDSKELNRNPTITLPCIPETTKTAFCEVSYNEKLFIPDVYTFDVIYAPNLLDATIFFEADLDVKSKTFILRNLNEQHCANDTMNVPNQYDVNYCICCGSNEPDDVLKCPGTTIHTTSSTTTTSTTTSTTTFHTTTKTTFTTSTATSTDPTTLSTKSIGPTDAGQYVINCNSPDDKMEHIYCQNTTLNSTNVSDYISQTKNAYNSETAQGVDIYMMSFILEKAANVSNMTLHDTGQMYLIFDSLLNTSSEHFSLANLRGVGSTERILSSVDTLLRKSDHDLQLLNASNLAMQKYNTPIDCSNTKSFGLADYGHQGFGWTDKHKPDAMIEIPANVACESGSQKSTPMYFVAYRRTQLFNRPNSNDIKPRTQQTQQQTLLKFLEMADNTNGDDVDTEKKLPKQDRCKKGLLPQNNRVMTATLVNQNKPSTKNGDKVMARLRYNKNQVKTSLHGHQTVTWWSAEKGWSTEDRCKTKEKDGYYTAECYHLTDFTLLIDGSEADPSLCDKGLSIFGIVVNVISMVSLLLLGIIQFINLVSPIKRKCYPIFYRLPWLRFRVEIIAFQYTISLFLFYLFFTAFSDQKMTGGPVGCHVFAGLIYFLLISCTMLTLFQAWRVLKLFAWSSNMDHILSLVTGNVVAIPVSIVVPFLVCIIAFLADRQFFNRNDDFCWIRPTSVVFAVVIPLTILVVNCIICSIIMTSRLYPNLRITAPIRRLVRTNSTMLAKSTRQKSRDRFLAILSIQFVLGLPWIFQYFTLFEPTATAWHYIFSFVNGSQGLTLFTMFLYRRIKAYRASKAANATSDFTTSRPMGETETTQLPQRRLTFSLSNETAKIEDNESVYDEIKDE